MKMNTFRISNRVSKLFQPISAIPKNAQIKNQNITSKSQRLMLELGIIRQASHGTFHLLPLGVRALQKLIQVVDVEMNKIDGQKVIFPSLTHSKLWKATGRLEETASELFTLQDRHKNTYVLSPTHEEAASDLLASIGIMSYKQFPIRLYQITSKYRDEMKPRFGLMRGRQFIMKDLYSFDVSLESARETYEAVSASYDAIFKRIGVEYVKVLGTTGNMGGSISHEYHYSAAIGEDRLLLCSKCGHSTNVELASEEKCPKCGTNDINVQTGIEVGHTFLLGEKYSKPLKAVYLTNEEGRALLQMGSYGLGLTRILGAAIEVLSLEYEIRWPQVFAPYKAIVIPPKGGSKEEIKNPMLSEQLYSFLENIPVLKDDILFDDRRTMTIGKRVLEAKRVGYPYIIVVGSKAVEDPALYELLDLNKNTQQFLNQQEIVNYLTESFVS